MEIQGQEVLSLQDALRCSTPLSIRWHHRKILRPTRNFLQTHLQESDIFLVHEWCVSEETHLVISRLLREISTRRSTSKSGTGKDYLLRYLRSPAKSTFKHLCRQTLLWLVITRKEPQEPWRTRRPHERDLEQSALTHARHMHCASRQLDPTANQRYDVPWDWLQEACQMARVCWGICCEGFCSKRGPHYKLTEVQRTSWFAIKWEERLRSHSEAVIRQATINLYSQVWKSLGDLFPKLYCIDLAEAYVMQESVSLRILCEKNRYDLWLPNGRLHEKPSAKGRTRKECRYKFLYQVPMSILLWENASCVPEIWGCMYNVVLGEPKVWENEMRNQIPMQPRKVQRNY